MVRRVLRIERECSYHNPNRIATPLLMFDIKVFLAKFSTPTTEIKMTFFNLVVGLESDNRQEF
jgi:hypothetical protein